jgi:hypothetical protein
LRLIAALLALPCTALAADLGVNVYGFSYHVERSRAKEIGVDNEFNPGLGVRYRVPYRERIDWIFDAGAYRDSGRNTAVFAAAGVHWHVSGGWRLGGALAAFHSDTYNRGKAFIAPIPVAAYEWRAVSLSVAYLPKVGDFNEINTFGFWLTFYPGRMQN